ncbi:MAG: DUF5663 domain-containing protein [Patescibacteria group bacterium]
MTNTLSKDIINEWGLGALPEEKQLDVVERLGRMLYQAILVRALDILSEKEQVEFDLVLDEDTTTPEDVLSFLKSKIPTFDNLVSDEKQNLKREILLPVI